MVTKRAVKNLALFALVALTAPMLFGTACPQTCPDSQQLVNGLCVTTSPGPSLSGRWRGTITGDVTVMQTQNPAPPNPNSASTTQTNHQTIPLQLVFNDSGLPEALPLPSAPFSLSFDPIGVSVFNVGETQILTNTIMVQIPIGAADIGQLAESVPVTLTVTESDLSRAHFRVVYATTQDLNISITTAAPGVSCQMITFSSPGTLTFEATATDGLLNVSLEFAEDGPFSATTGASPCPPAAPTTQTGTFSASGKLEGTLARG